MEVYKKAERAPYMGKAQTPKRRFREGGGVPQKTMQTTLGPLITPIGWGGAMEHGDRAEACATQEQTSWPRPYIPEHLRTEVFMNPSGLIQIEGWGGLHVLPLPTKRIHSSGVPQEG